MSDGSEAQAMEAELSERTVGAAVWTPEREALAKAIGQRVADLRQARRESMTQTQLAKAAGLGVSFVSMIERGQRLPSLDSLDDIAKALGVELPALFDTPEEIRSRARAAKFAAPLTELVLTYNLSASDVRTLAGIGHVLFSAERRGRP